MTSLAHAWRYVRRGVARFTEDGGIEFLHRHASHGRVVLGAVSIGCITDSGFTTAAYPMRAGGMVPFPALSRMGAGL